MNNGGENLVPKEWLRLPGFQSGFDYTGAVPGLVVRGETQLGITGDERKVTEKFESSEFRR
jgi:hypothetical protein